MWTFLAVGLVAGSIVSSWQGYKDPPWEGFVVSKFLRSMVTGIAIGLAVFALQHRGLMRIDNLGLLLLSILATERLAGEAYKGFFRVGPHPEYFRLFARLGVPVGNFAVKIACGVVFLVAGLYLYWLFGRLAGSLIEVLGATPAAGAAIGATAGMMVATGGALKDSQFEGFKPGKFVRSPVVASLGGIALVGLSANPLLVAIGVVGFERVAVEFYKTFLTKQVRGIHAGKAVAYPEWLERRWVFLVSFLSGVAVCAVLLDGDSLRKESPGGKTHEHVGALAATKAGVHAERCGLTRHDAHAHTEVVLQASEDQIVPSHGDLARVHERRHVDRAPDRPSIFGLQQKQMRSTKAQIIEPPQRRCGAVSADDPIVEHSDRACAAERVLEVERDGVAGPCASRAHQEVHCEALAAV